MRPYLNIIGGICSKSPGILARARFNPSLRCQREKPPTNSVFLPFYFLTEIPARPLVGRFE